jgi:hypothetical protein
MKIVIDIDEKDYKRIKEIPKIFDSLTSRAYKVIREGTPLPKGHGRLGDLDALEEYFRNVRKELKASDYKNGIEFFVRDEMLLNVQQFIHLCDAIIEGSDSE